MLVFGEQKLVRMKNTFFKIKIIFMKFHGFMKEVMNLHVYILGK